MISHHISIGIYFPRADRHEDPVTRGADKILQIPKIHLEHVRRSLGGRGVDVMGQIRQVGCWDPGMTAIAGTVAVLSVCVDHAWTKACRLEGRSRGGVQMESKQLQDARET